MIGVLIEFDVLEGKEQAFIIAETKSAIPMTE